VAAGDSLIQSNAGHLLAALANDSAGLLGVAKFAIPAATLGFRCLVALGDALSL
jgi:hypothetical protein